MKFITKIPFSIILFFFFSFIFLYFLHPISGDGDFFHDLSTGKYVVTHMSIPHADDYTFTAHGRPWVANAWGTGILYYFIYTSFGANAISLFTASVAVLLFVLLYLLLKRYGVGKWVILVTLAFGASIIALRFDHRPEIFTYPFLVTLLLFDTYFPKKPRLLFCIPFLFLLWSVLYVGSVFIGLGLLLLLFINRIVQNRFTFDKQALVYGSVFVLSALASLLNGNGLSGLLYITKIPEIAKTSGEWLGIFTLLAKVQDVPMLELQYRIALYFSYLLVFLVLIMLCLITNRQIFKKHLLFCLLSIGIFAPFFSIRNISLSVVVSLPLFALMISSCFKKWKLFAFIPVLILTLVLLGVSNWTNPMGIGQDTDQFSPDVIAFLQQHHITGNVFAEQSFSSFLTFALYPQVLIYADTRDDLYTGTSILSTYNDLQYYGGDLRPLLNYYRVSTVIGNTTGGGLYEALLYSPDWNLVFITNNYYVFVRKNNPETMNLPSYTGVDFSSGDGAKQNKENVALAEYTKLLEQYPHAGYIQLAAAQLHYAMKDPHGVISLAQAMQIPNGPVSPVLASKRDSLLTLSYLMINQCTMAKQAVDALHDDVTGKYIFDLSKTLSSNVEEYYMFYYLVCEHNFSDAQTHLQTFLLDPSVSTAEKQHAKVIFTHFTNTNN